MDDGARFGAYFVGFWSIAFALAYSLIRLAPTIIDCGVSLMETVAHALGGS